MHLLPDAAQHLAHVVSFLVTHAPHALAKVTGYLSKLPAWLDPDK